jgi:hypothetical protein
MEKNSLRRFEKMYGKHNSGVGFFGVVGLVLLIALAVAAGFFLSAFFVMLAWGGIAAIFGWITISYVQALSVALGLLIVGGMLSGFRYSKK